MILVSDASPIISLSAVAQLGLLEAKQRGFLPAVTPVMSDLLVRAGFRVSPQLYRYVVETAGES